MPSPQTVTHLQECRELARCLTGDGAVPSPTAIEHGRNHWLGAWLKACFDSGTSSPQPSLQPEVRTKLNSDFASSFARLAALNTAWSMARTQLDQSRIPFLTIGCLPYAASLYPHPAAKYSQDLDLLIHPRDAAGAELALKAAGFTRMRGHSVWRVTTAGQTIELDLHVTPGEERRNPALRHAYLQTTDSLFASATTWPDSPHWNGAEGALCLSPPALANNRVIHFFKHYCHPLRHGLELMLLLRSPMDMDQLRHQVEISRSGRVWAVVLEVLRAWGGDQFGGHPMTDPTTSADREFASRPRSRILVAAAASGTGEPVTPRLEYAMLAGTAKVSYALGVMWPPRDILLSMYGREPDGVNGIRGMALVSRLRCARIGKTVRALVTRRV